MRAQARSPKDDVAINKSIGRHGLALIESIVATKKPGERVKRADPLQRRLAGNGRLGHGDGPDLSGA